MNYKRFEELPVWNSAMDLADAVYNLTEAEAFKGRFSLRDQLERAALSVSNNIAEGFERGTTAELLSFLYIARGSAAEVRSMLCFLLRRAAFSGLNQQIADAKTMAESCARQLYRWADTLQNSASAGQRRWTDKERTGKSEKEGREAFLAELQRVVANEQRADNDK